MTPLEMAPRHNKKEILQAMFLDVFSSPVYEEEKLREHFCPEYTQSVDGKTLNFEQFCQHIRVQKQVIKNLTVAFKTLVEDGDIVFSNHVARAEMLDGRTGEIHVIAEFRFKGDKILACDELTHMISGDPQDRDLGSRH